MRRWAMGMVGAVFIGCAATTPAAADPPPADVICDSNGGGCTAVVTNPGGGGGGGGGGNSNPSGPKGPSGGGANGGGGGGGNAQPVSAKDALSKEEREALAAACGGAQALDSDACRALDAPAAGGGGGAPRVTATPAMALEIARAKLKLPNPKMGTAPCTGEGCVGRVGVPTWFWTQAWTSTSVSATAGPHTVTITAQPSKVVWSLGDGQAVTCTSAGTKYEEWRGFTSSPDCGLPNGYKTMGHYTVTATMTWQVSWSGAIDGSETMTTSDSAQVAIGEVQAIVEN